MAKQQLLSYSYTCDVCGETIPDSDSADATNKVSWEGTEYVVDVCARHRSELGDLLAQLKTFVSAGNRVTGRRGRRPAVPAAAAPRGRRGAASQSAGTSPKRSDLSAIRAWARETGQQVSERGRIPGHLLEAYDAAASASAPAEAAAAEPQEAPAAPATRSRKSAAAKSAAPKAPRGRRAAASSGASPKRSDLGSVRAWARENGMKVSERGRIPGDLIARYDAANNGGTPQAEQAEPAAPATPRKRRPRKAAAAAV